MIVHEKTKGCLALVTNNRGHGFVYLGLRQGSKREIPRLRIRCTSSFEALSHSQVNVLSMGGVTKPVLYSSPSLIGTAQYPFEASVQK